MIKKAAKILGITLTAIIGLMVILLLLVHRGSFNSYISRVITKQVSNSIVGELVMKPFTGSPFSEFTFHGVKLLHADTVLINAQEIDVSYSLSKLLRKKILIHTLAFSDLSVDAHQQLDSTWNVLNMFAPVQQRPPEKDTTTDGFLSEIEIASFSIASLKANINPRYESDFIPREIDAAIELGFHSEKHQLTIDMHQFNLRTNIPDFHVQELSGRFSLQDKTLYWKEMRLVLSETDLTSTGVLPMDNVLGANAEMKFNPLAFSDFQPFLANDTLYGSPDVEINYNGEERRKQFVINIASSSQKMELDGWLEGLANQDSYALKLYLSGFDGSTWTGDSRMKTLITGTMELEGTGYDIQSNRLGVQGNFDTISYREYAADTLEIYFDKLGDNATGKVRVLSNRGDLVSELKLSQIFDRLNYTFTSSLKGLNIGSFIPASDLTSDLNLFLKANGSGYNLKTLSTEIFLEATNSQLAGKPVDHFEADLTMDKGKYAFNGLDLQTPFFGLFADGEGDLYSDNNISFQLDPYNLNPLLEPFGIPETQLQGKVDGNVTGRLDSLNLVAELAFDSISYDSISAINFHSNLSVNLYDSSYTGKMDLNSGPLLFGNTRSESIQFSSVFSEELLDNYLMLQLNDSLRTDMHFLIETGNVPIIHLPAIELVVNNSIWTGGGDSTLFALGKDTILVQQFQLSNGPQMIYADGRFSFKGDEDFEIAIQNLNLKELESFLPATSGVNGTLSSEISFYGNARNPEMIGRILISDPGYQDINFKQLQFELEYRNELLAINGALDDHTKQRFYTDIALPLHLSFVDSIGLLEERAGFRAEIHVDSLNSKIVNPYFKSIGLKSEGYISLQTLITNTLHNPNVAGDFSMYEGSVDYGEKGILYTDIGLEGSFSNERITLDKVNINAGEGNLEASGYADIALLGDRKLKNIDVQISANNFKVIENDEISALINADLELRGPYPDLEGFFTMQNGKLAYENMGIIYEGINLDGEFSGERITLGNLEIQSGGGSLSASGYADIALLGDQNIKNIDLQIHAKDFKALDSEQGSAVINSNLQLSGPYTNAKIEGQVTILRAIINTDAIMAAQNMNSVNPNPPLLVKAMQDTLPVDTTIYIRSKDSLKLTENTFYNNLSGEFTVRVPGNTWVKGKDMNFELNGELRAVKESSQIDLFGDLNVNRGYYKFYGKRFSFNRGKVTFTGGGEINPLIDFEVLYAFRDEDRELRKLKLYLKGRTQNPDIRFTLDDMFVEEKDAIAYILFGRRMDNLTTQQSASVEQSALNLSRDVALGQISNLLKNALESTLQLDVVEVSGGENWQSGSVTIGKYITNDLYVRYEQNFDFDKKDKILEAEEIALEYQIIRSLFLQATNQRENSGFDLIFKKRWK